jgi:biopolymer transport protein ExbD
MNTPQINVTPLIDVLLVLLIIFMVVSPIKPSAFHARIPTKPDNAVPASPNIDSLVVTVARDGTLKLNMEPAGTVADATLVSLLSKVFADRAANGAITNVASGDPERPFNDRVERTVFVKAPKSLDYGTVSRVIDAVKLAGAYPISLQIDALE